MTRLTIALIRRARPVAAVGAWLAGFVVLAAGIAGQGVLASWLIEAGLVICWLTAALTMRHLDRHRDGPGGGS